MLKAEDCLRAEEGRVASYLHINSKTKLMSQVWTLLTMILNIPFHPRPGHVLYCH